MSTSAKDAALLHRAHHLDALRGLAALLVVLTHYLAATYPYAVFADPARYPLKHTWELWMIFPPFSLLSAAHFAVCLFFVLSGYVLSLNLIGKQNNWRGVLGSMIKRPFRLGGLTLFSLLAGAMLWRLGWLYNLDAAALSGSQHWLGVFWKTEFNFSEFISSLIKGRAGAEYNPPLWTLKIELIGSFLVFASLLLINHVDYKLRLACLMVILLALHDQYYSGFIIGMLIADAHQQWQKRCSLQEAGKIQYAEKTQPLWYAGNPGIWLLGCIALLGACYPYYASEILWLELQEKGWPNMNAWGSQISMLAATLVFLFVLFSHRARTLLNRRVLIWLGKISFALYVLHFLVLGSFSSWVLLKLTPTTSYDNAVLLSASLSMLLLFPLAALATRWIDRPSIALGQFAERLFFQGLVALAPSISVPSWFQKR